LVEKYFLSKYLEKSKVINHIYVLFFVAISFAIFSADGFKEAMNVVGGMFGAGSIPFISGSFIYNLRNYGGVIIIAILCATPLFVKIKERFDNNRKVNLIFNILEIPFLMFLLVVTTAYLADGSFNPFLYFRF